jgi:signal transduction histidine kinase
MTRADALRGLTSLNQRERLSAARTLSRVATSGDIPALKRALRSEAVPWIRSALEAGLARAVAAPGHPETNADLAPLATDDALAAEVYSRAVEELTDRFVHEFRPLVGLARVHANHEITDFETSQTGAVLRRMQALLRGIDTLGKAAAAPKVKTFDLGTVVREAARSCVDELATLGDPVVGPSFDGQEPLAVESDPDLLMLAIRNGIRNALEASAGIDQPVVIAWGQSDVDFWVSVLDFGIGLPTEGKALFAIGSTTKPEHFGIGLAIVERVAATLGGIITLESLPDGTTRFELRVKRPAAQ